MGKFQESKEFIRGRNGERLVADILRRRGYFIVPSYDFSGSEGDKAPKMHGPGRLSLIIPDLDVCRSGYRRWVEVKTKERADYTRKIRRWEHGINEHHYQSYLRVQEESGCEVELIVFEESTGCVLSTRLDDITYNGRFSPNFDCGRGGRFWARSAMVKFAEVQVAPSPSKLNGSIAVPAPMR